MNSFDFFDSHICLSNDDAEFAIAQQEFNRVGLTCERFNALPDIGPHQSFSRSARRILINFYGSGKQRLLHLEDDCVFRDLSHLPQSLTELPDDWDIVYLGANLVCWNNGEPEPERYSPHLFRVRAAWTTHAIGYNRKVVPFILENQPGFSEQMLDQWLGLQLPNLNAYCVAPMVAYQRARHSSIWGRFDDYTLIFEASEAKLK
jgi:hypothetical protein